MTIPKGQKFNIQNWILSILMIIMIVCPLGVLILKAVTTDGHLDLPSFFTVMLQSKNFETIINSLNLGFWVVILSSLISFPLAYILSRTEINTHKWLEIVFLIPFMTPPYINSMGWILFTQNKGLLQQILPNMEGFTNWFYSFKGIVIVMSLHTFPFLLNFLKNSMLNINANLEEASFVFGANKFYNMRKVFLPLLTSSYAIGALLVFVKTLSEYGTPATFGYRIHMNFFTSQIHQNASMYPVDFKVVSILSSLLVLICLILWLVQRYWTNKTAFSLVNGKGSRNVFYKLNKKTKILCWTYIIFIGTN